MFYILCELNIWEHKHNGLPLYAFAFFVSWPYENTISTTHHSMFCMLCELTMWVHKINGTQLYMFAYSVSRPYGNTKTMAYHSSVCVCILCELTIWEYKNNSPPLYVLYTLKADRMGTQKQRFSTLCFVYSVSWPDGNTKTMAPHSMFCILCELTIWKHKNNGSPIYVLYTLWADHMGTQKQWLATLSFVYSVRWPCGYTNNKYAAILKNVRLILYSYHIHRYSWQQKVGRI